MKKLITLLLLISAGTFAQAQTSQTVTLKIEVEGIKVREGNLRITLFNSEDTYLKTPAKFLSVDLATHEGNLFTIDELPGGAYAISIVQDKNKNGELDMGAMGPVEPYGFSNDAYNRFGPAAYEDAVMDVNVDMETKIKLQ